MKLTFKRCTLALLDKLFDLQEVANMPLLRTWLESEIEISDMERLQVEFLQRKLTENFRIWNGLELAYGFIAPLLTLVDFSEKDLKFFAGRSLGGKIGDVELSGKPDGMIASGQREPEQPYFCLHEYKREEDYEGEPAGQVLGAMLVAQELNNNEQPIYGCYVKGNIWYFMALQGREYSISNSYVATREDVFAIFCALKIFKQMVHKMIRHQSVQDRQE